MKKSFILVSIFSIFVISVMHVAALRAEDKKITYVLITVDTEGPSPHSETIPHYGRLLLPEQITANINGRSYGIKRMMDIAEKYGFKITFFLDVMEVKLFGVETMKTIVQFIESRGHDLQLHIDSLYLYDPRRHYLSQYSLEEQKMLLTQGRKLFEEWSGKSPVAHRAGAYAANKDTLSALKKSGIPVDSSLYYKNSKSEIQGFYSTKISISKDHGIIQLPMTVFEVQEFAKLSSLKLEPVKRYKKVDIDSCSGEEIKAVLSQAAESKLDMVILFMHSWSFIKRWANEPDDRVADIEDVREFDNVLQFIKNHDRLSILSTGDFYKKILNKEMILSYSDQIPKIEKQTSMVNYLRRRAGIDRNNIRQWIIGSSLVIFVIILILIKFRIKRKRTEC